MYKNRNSIFNLDSLLLKDISLLEEKDISAFADTLASASIVWFACSSVGRQVCRCIFCRSFKLNAITCWIHNINLNGTWCLPPVVLEAKLLCMISIDIQVCWISIMMWVTKVIINPLVKTAHVWDHHILMNFSHVVFKHLRGEFGSWRCRPVHKEINLNSLNGYIPHVD